MNPDEYFDQFLENPEPSFQMALKKKLKGMDAPPIPNIKAARLLAFPQLNPRWRFATLALVLIIGATFLFSNQSVAQVIYEVMERFVAQSRFVEEEVLSLNTYENEIEIITQSTTDPADLPAALTEAQSKVPFHQPTYIPEGYSLVEITQDNFVLIHLIWKVGDVDEIYLAAKKYDPLTAHVVENVDAITTMTVEDTEIAIVRGAWGTTADGERVFMENGLVSYRWVFDEVSYSLHGFERYFPEEEAIKMIGSIILQE